MNGPTPRRLNELEGYLTDPSVVAVAEIHSAVRLAVAAGHELLAAVRSAADRGERSEAAGGDR